jgi:ankyrin repeat protein
MAPRPTTPKKKSTFVDLDRHHRGPDGNGAIHLAILTENANILQQLLKRKFDPDFPDMSGQTGLMLITKSSYTTKRHHLFNALRNAGASLKPRDHNGKTVYDHARDGDLHWLNILNSGSDQ